MHVEVLKFPFILLHKFLVLVSPIPAGLLISRVDINDLTCDLIPQQMHLLLVLMHEVTHIDPILQVVIVFLFMINKNLIYQLVCFLLVQSWDLFARGRENRGVGVDLKAIDKKIVFSHSHHMHVHCTTSLRIESHV